MLKQMIEFSKQLAEKGFYELDFRTEGEENYLYVIVPLRNKKAFYYVIENDQYNKFIDKTGKNNVRRIDDIPDDFRKILKRIEKLTQKLPGDEKGNKSIGANKGVNSYNLFIFKIPKTDIKLIKQGQTNKAMESIKKKIKIVYNKEKLKEISDNFPEIKNVIKFEELLFSEEELSFIVSDLTNVLDMLKEDDDLKKLLSNVFFVFELEKSLSIYETFHRNYLRKKVFVSEDKRNIRKGECPICGQESELSIPATFHNLNEKKLFLKHHGRKESLNSLMCRDCALELSRFYHQFLKKITIFPLFIDPEFFDKEIELFKSGTSIEKKSFKEIIENIHKGTDRDTLNFYLIIYSGGKNSLIFLDYVSNFRYKLTNNLTIFDIEDKLNKFFDDKMKTNYFNEISLKDESLKLQIEKYRSHIFDFIYRARYENINGKLVEEIFFDSLKRILRKFYQNSIEEERVVNLFKIYAELNKYFGGDYMETLRNIKSDDLYKREQIENEQEFYFISGKITRYLLSLSQTSNKTHALVEPFVNVASSTVMLERIVDLFNKYKHNIDFDNKKLDKLFSLILSYYNSGKVEKNITKQNRFFFFEGYFSGDKL